MVIATSDDIHFRMGGFRLAEDWGDEDSKRSGTQLMKTKG